MNMQKSCLSIIQGCPTQKFDIFGAAFKFFGRKVWVGQTLQYHMLAMLLLPVVVKCGGGYNLYIRNFLKLYKTIAKNCITIGYPILHSIIYNNIVTSSNNIL